MFVMKYINIKPKWIQTKLHKNVYQYKKYITFIEISA